MPMYEYKCSECEHIFTEIHPIDKRHLPCDKPCPQCNKNAVEHSICASALISPIRLGRVKPRSDFRERMKQIKKGHRYDSKAKIKDY